MDIASRISSVVIARQSYLGERRLCGSTVSWLKGRDRLGYAFCVKYALQTIVAFDHGALHGQHESVVGRDAETFECRRTRNRSPNRTLKFQGRLP